MKKKRSRKSTRKARRKHFIRRTAQRYGLDLTQEDADAIAEKIQANKATHVLSESNTRKHFDVEYKGEVIRVVYSKASRSVVTALPKR